VYNLFASFIFFKMSATIRQILVPVGIELRNTTFPHLNKRVTSCTTLVVAEMVIASAHKTIVNVRAFVGSRKVIEVETVTVTKLRQIHPTVITC